jgi:DNA-binding GntR family transcriptional regulator
VPHCLIVDNLQFGFRMDAAANIWQLGSIDRASTTEQVLYELREAIIDGRIAQGEALREVSLATAFGTGRSAVREAIRQLVQEGLVDSELHRGAFVRVLSLADRLDVYVAREAIEMGVAKRVGEASTPADLSGLRRALEELRERAHGHDHVTEDEIAADIRFHQELVRLAGSPRLIRAHETLAAETRMLLRHHPTYPWADYVGDHERIFEAIERRDRQAPDVVGEHLRLSARLIREELARKAADGAGREGQTHPGEAGTVR